LIMLTWGSHPKIPIVQGSGSFQVGEHIHTRRVMLPPTPRE